VFKYFLKSVKLVGLCTVVVGLSGFSLNTPDYKVDVPQISKAALCQGNYPRFCNPSHYTVRGKTYEVLQNPTSYCARGVASWYGPRFDKKKTSDGEIYNMYAMTAASKTLPIPCYVRVTDLKTDQCVVVKVNDRGPFKAGRIIDLSYGAAKKLGITQTGTAPVEVTFLHSAQSPSVLV
jgi:rare lipoprotein A